MKTWIQVLAGIAAGIIIALILPEEFIVAGDTVLTSDVISSITSTTFSIGRYLVLPLLFFSMVISISQLQRDKNFIKVTAKTLALTAIFSILLVIVGVISAVIFSPGQIPVVIDNNYQVDIPSFKELLDLSFPSNIFSVFQYDFSQSSSLFIPFFVFAIILGIFITKTSREESEPTFNLIDSLSRISFKASQYFLRVSFIWVTIITCFYITTLKNVQDIKIFMPLTIMLLVLTIIIIFIIYPIVFYYTCDKRNPFKYIFSELPTLLTSAISGDLFFTNILLVSSQKKSFRIKRENAGFTTSFLVLFSKGGTALVSIISFIIILKSYSSLEITASQILWVGIMSFLISFCLPTKAIGSTVASLSILCALYGYGGMESSFTILAPAFPIIGAIATVINTATILLINLILDPEKNQFNE